MTDTSREALIKSLRITADMIHLGEHIGWGTDTALMLHAADMLEADASRITELEALSVTSIMIDVVPGDGSGLEIFAKSTSDVEDLLTKMGEKIEDFESSKLAQQVAVPMTDGQILELWTLWLTKNFGAVRESEAKIFARMIEAHHGIGEKP